MAAFVDRRFSLVFDLLVELPAPPHRLRGPSCVTQAHVHGWRSRYDSTFLLYAWGGEDFAAVGLYETPFDELHRAGSAETTWYDGLPDTPFTLRHDLANPAIHVVEPGPFAPLNDAEVTVFLIRQGESPDAVLQETLELSLALALEEAREHLRGLGDQLSPFRAGLDVDWAAEADGAEDRLPERMRLLGEALTNDPVLASLGTGARFGHAVFRMGMGLQQAAIVLDQKLGWRRSWAG